MSIGTVAAVTHDRTVAGSPIARTRKVTVAKIICGVDVSSKTLDARIGQDGPSQSFDRTPEGIRALTAFCKSHDVEFVAMEATGGYEKLPFSLLWLAGVPCAILNPRSVRRFAEAMGTFEKTDDIDTGVITHFAEVKRIVPQTPASATPARARSPGDALAPGHRSAHQPDQPTPPRHRCRRAGGHRRTRRLAQSPNPRPRGEDRPKHRRRPLVEGARCRLSLHQGRRRPHRRPLDGRFARNRHDFRQKGRQARRLGAARQRQWKSQRQTLDLLWPRQRAIDPVRRRRTGPPP